jgi:hypothetical protein
MPVPTENSELIENSRVLVLTPHSVLGMLQHVGSLVAVLPVDSVAGLSWNSLCVISCMFCVANGPVGPT